MRDQNDQRELIRSYLLGRLAGPRLEEIEVRLLSDAQFRDDLQMVQDELIDDYTFGVLSWRERWRFKRRFLLTPERAEKLRFARAVQAHLGGGQESRAASRRKLVIAVVGACCLLVAAVIFIPLLRWRQSQSLREQMARAERARTEMRLEVERWTKQPPPDFRQSTPLVELTLAPGLFRGQGDNRRITFTNPKQIAQIRLEIPEQRFENYEATLLKNEDNEDVVLFNLGGLHAETEGGNRVLLIRIPAKSLAAGNYELRLRGTRAQVQTPDASSYSFQVIHRSTSP
jgi:hypothetical protein